MKNTNPLIKLFERYAYAQDYTTAFSAMLDYFLIAFKYYETEEDQAAAINQLTTYQKKDEHIALFTEIGELAEGFEDPLGALYEQLISKGRNGQFFTPEPVAQLIAISIVNDAAGADQASCDTACGSGRMLLAAAKVNRHQKFYGADIDPLCCKIALANLLINSLSGEIAHMDSLSNTFYKGYKTGTVIRDGYHYPWYREFTDPEESYIWLRPTAKSAPTGFDTPFEPTKSPLMSEGVQGNLFEQL